MNSELLNTTWFWLSFTDATRSVGDQFLGVTIVSGPTLVDAVTNSHVLGVNPGGAIMSLEIPPEHVPTEIFRNRLLSRSELEVAGLI